MIFYVVKMIFEGKVDFLDCVLDSGASIDYGDVIFSKAEQHQRAVSCSARVGTINEASVAPGCAVRIPP